MKLASLICTLVAIICTPLAFSATGGAQKSQRIADTVYFLDSSSERVQRYDLAAETWLDPIAIDESASCFALNDSYLFVAYGKILYRYDLDGGNKTHLGNILHSVVSLHTDGNLLMVNHSSSNNAYFDSYDIGTLARLDSFSSYYTFDSDCLLDPENNRIYDTRWSDSRVEIRYDDTGTFTENTYSSSSNNAAPGDFFLSWPEKDRMVGATGWIYDRQTFYPIAQLAKTDCIAFVDGVLPVIVSGKSLIAYSKAFQETGRVPLQNAFGCVHIQGEDAFVFAPNSQEASGFALEIVALEDLDIADPASPIDPSKLAFEPDEIFAASNDKLYLSNHNLSSLFTWNIATQGWDSTIELEGLPLAIRYAAETDLILIAYSDGRITKIDPSQPTPSETLVVDTESTINSLVAAGAFIYTSLYSNDWSGIKIFDTNGNVTGFNQNQSDTFDAVWTYRRVVSSKGNSSYLYNYVVQEDGSAGTYGSKSFNDTNTAAPLFPHPSDPLLLTSSGILYDPQVNEIAGVIPESTLGGVWIDGTLYTLHKGAIKTWTLPTYAEGASMSFSARAYSLTSTAAGNLALVTIGSNGKPRITILDTDYQIVAKDNLATPELSAGKITAGAISIDWSASGGAQTYTVERASASDGPWTEVTITGFESSSYADIDIAIGETYYYRVKAANGELESAYSGVVAIDTSRSPVAGESLDPSSLSRYANSAVVDQRNILYLTIYDTKGIYRYDLTEQNWLEAIPTPYKPSDLLYSEARDSLFFRDNDGNVVEVNLKGSPLVPVKFADRSDNYYGYVHLASEDFVLITESSYHLLYDPVGQLLSSTYINDIDSGAFILWDEDESSYSWSNSWSIYHSKIRSDWSLESSHDSLSDYETFIAANSDHSLILSNSGNIYSGQPYSKLHTMNQSLTGGLWIGDQLFTLTSNQVRKHDPSTYEITDSYALNRNGRYLLESVDGNLVVVQGDNYSAQEIIILDTDLDVAAPETIAAPAQIQISESTSYQNVIRWTDVGGETGYTLERRIGIGTWETIAELDSNTTSYTDNGIDSSLGYSYRVKGTNGDTPSAYSDSLVVASAPPTSATNLVATKLVDNTYLLTWEPSENALSYGVESSTNGGIYFYEQYATNAPVQTINIQPGELYQFRIRSNGSYGQKAYSESITLYENLTKPDTPYQLQSSPIDYHTVQLSWDQNPRTLSYLLERKDLDGENLWKPIATLDLYASPYRDTTVEEESRYQYRLFAVNPAGTSQARVSSTVTTPKRYPPNKPFLTAGQNSDNSVLLNWGCNHPDASFRILKRLAGETEWSELEIPSPSDRSYTDSGLEAGQTYVYSAVAYDVAGESEYAASKIITVIPQQTLFVEDFTNGINSTNFSEISGTVLDSETPGIGKYLDPEHAYRSLNTNFQSLPDGGTLSFDLRFTGASNNITNNKMFVYFDFQSKSILVSSLAATETLKENWTRFSVQIPKISGYTEGRLSLYHSSAPDYANRFLIDNIKLSKALPPVPASPLTVVAKSAIDGGFTVFWLPSLHAESYRVDVSQDGGDTWQTVISQLSPVTYYHEPSPYNDASIYRVSAVNTSGSSEPTLSNEAASDIEIAEAVQLGVEKVLATPDTYQLYNAAQLEDARSQGQQDVQNNPGAFGLYQQEFISNLYYRLASDPVQIKGDLMSFGWILYRSSDLINWTEHPFSIEFENETENEAEFIKIRPDAK